MNFAFKAALVIVTIAFCSTNVNAQQQGYAVAPQPTTPQVNAYQPQTQNPFYFGMNLRIVNEYGSAKLFIDGVTPGGPAQLAGLEYGDEIVSVNGQPISPSNSSIQAVRNLNRMVRFVGASTPAAAASASAGASAGAYATAAVPSRPAPKPTANMVVRNVRNGQLVNITVFPRQVAPVGGGGVNIGAPAQASPAASSYGR